MQPQHLREVRPRDQQPPRIVKERHSNQPTVVQAQLLNLPHQLQLALLLKVPNLVEARACSARWLQLQREYYPIRPDLKSSTPVLVSRSHGPTYVYESSLFL